jgi:hypothetical protein
VYEAHDESFDPLVADPLSDSDLSLESQVSESLQRGLACKQWWEEKQRNDNFAHKFPLIRAFNRPDTAFGFFDEIRLDGTAIPIMGNVDEEIYDQSKAEDVFSWRDELREFVLRYFLRISDFRLPDAYTDQRRSSLPDIFDPFCWCTKPADTRAGFGYSQLYFKHLATGTCFKFPDHLRFKVVDLRNVGTHIEWLVLNVSIFDFDLTFRPFGNIGPEIRFPLNEETLVIISREFIEDRIEPEPGVAAEFGFGYAVLRQPREDGILAYGPGQFEVGFSQFLFRILDSGETRIRRVFVVNRPKRLLNVPLNPLRFAERAVGLFSAGRSGRSPGLGPDISFDPILSFVGLANMISLGLADRLCCISREQLEQQMLVQHFMQNYQMIVGSLNTWRQMPNWRDSGSLPQWAVTGVSS